MSEGIIIAMIAASSAISVALIGVMVPLLVSTRKHARIGAGSAAAAADQLVNNHVTNWRDNADKNQQQLVRILNAHGRRLTSIERRLSDVEEDTTPHGQPAAT